METPAETPAHPLTPSPAPSWWNRECGPRDVLRLALPLMISTASWTIMNFIDRMYLTWYDRQAMAATLPAGMMQWLLMCFPLGVCMYANTFVAQYHGAGRDDRIGLAIGQALRIALYVSPLMLLAAPLAPWFFSAIKHEPGLASQEVLYFQVMSIGTIAQLLTHTLQTFFIGQGRTSVVMVVDVIGAVMNIVLDWPFIFGVQMLGIAPGGIEGAAWATVIALWAKVLIYWWLLARPELRKPYRLDQIWKYDHAMMSRLLYFGCPSGFQFFVDVVGFSSFILLMGSLGSEAMEATTLAFNVNAVAFVPMFGVGMAISTIVGQQQGANKPNLGARATWTGAQIALVYTGFFGVLYFFTPDLFVYWFSFGSKPEEFASLRMLTILLLRFVAAYCVFDALNIIFASALKGAGDTQFVVLATLAIAAPAVLVGWYGLTYLDWGLVACWWVITIWIMTLGLTFFLRFVQGRWRTMRVIEHDVMTLQPAEMKAALATDEVEESAA
jgi:MATE family multidrug resistance protein